MLRPSNTRLTSEYVAGGRHGLGRTNRRARPWGLLKGAYEGRETNNIPSRVVNIIASRVGFEHITLVLILNISSPS